jgi:hypothetical protein
MARKGAVAERVRASAGRSVELVRALPADAAIDAEVDLGMTGDAYLLQARLKVSLPGLEREVAQAIVDPGPPDLPVLRGDPAGRHRRDDQSGLTDASAARLPCGYASRPFRSLLEMDR